MDMEPPVEERYMELFKTSPNISNNIPNSVPDFDECVLPVIDLDGFEDNKKLWENKIIEAASEWGFFQIVNHGIPKPVLETMQYEEKNLFHQPFSQKNGNNCMKMFSDGYRWGNLKATCPKQFPWSESFHIPVADIATMDQNNTTFRTSVETYVKEVEKIARKLCEVLAKKLVMDCNSYFEENCPEKSSYLRLNRYPPCPFSSQVYGMVPHTDSDFLTVLYQDQIGGLQLKKDGHWFTVKPSPTALVINIGDLFQALSNGLYKSIEHRVVAPTEVERLSAAYFFCPSYDALIQASTNLNSKSLYRSFTFREYKAQIQQDVESTGDKVGLSRFQA